MSEKKFGHFCGMKAHYTRNTTAVSPFLVYCIWYSLAKDYR